MPEIPQHMLDTVMDTYRAWRPFADALEAERAEDGTVPDGERPAALESGRGPRFSVPADAVEED